MRKILPCLSALLLFFNATKAQYVNLPDTNFRNYLRWQYPTCFNASGQLDTTCSEIVNEDSLNMSFYFPVPDINMTGLRFFKNLTLLDFSYASSNHKSMPELPPVLKVLNCSFTTFNSFPSSLPQTLQYIYSTRSNFMRGYGSLGGFTQLPASLLHLDCSEAYIDSLPNLPPNLKFLDCNQSYSLSKLPSLPSSLQYLNCHDCSISNMPSLPNSLTYLNCARNALTSLPALPPLLDTLYCGACSINSLPALPNSLRVLSCGSNQFTSLPALPQSLVWLDCSRTPFGWGGIDSLLTSLPTLPAGLKFLGCREHSITSLPALPNSLDTLYCSSNQLSSLPDLPGTLTVLDCSNNILSSLPVLPGTLINFGCSNNKLRMLPTLPTGLRYLECGTNPLYNLPQLPDSLRRIYCAYDSLSSLPVLPLRLESINCHDNQITNLPQLPPFIRSVDCGKNLLSQLPTLPVGLSSLYCYLNNLTYLPELPNTLNNLRCEANNIYCFPVLPTPATGYLNIYFDGDKIKCIPNLPAGVYLEWYDNNGNHWWQCPLCNPTNNVNNCAAFPVMQGSVFFDSNNNGIKDINERIKSNTRVNLSNNSYSFTNNNGLYEIGADSIGNYSLSTNAPRYYRYAPASYNFNFTNYDTLVTNRNFALQIDSIVDELTIRITPVNWAARPGFSFPYLISYENTGTTTLSPNIVFDYDQTRLDYNTSSVTGVTGNTDMLAFNTGTLSPGESGSFIGYFTLKTTVPLGDTLNAKATINANSFTAYDSVQTIVRGAFDPNDKQATPQLSPSQVANGKYIDYTIRFQNTGTDTAFNIVISDTLNENLQAGTLQMLVSSHTCRATVKDNIVFFEFLNILLPDSNVNEKQSHGFVSFSIKPQTTVAANTTITNKAAIYFDYNAPVITNIAGTLIKDFTVIPLKLVSFSAVPQNDNTTTLYWNTANEINTMQFSIEQSTDGNKFIAVRNITAKEKAINDYSASVPDANNSFVYYRLKIIDKDGTFAFSPIIKIDRRKTTAGIAILTNPVKDFIVLSTSDRALYNSQASIINTNGAVVISFLIKEGSQTVATKGLPPGIYYLRTMNGSSKVVIQ